MNLTNGYADSENGKVYVTVRVKGKDKTAYLASLRKTLEHIFDRYTIIKPELRYEVLLPETYKKNNYSDTLKMPLMVLESAIRGCLRAGRAFFDAPNERDIPLDATQRGYGLGGDINDGAG